jgi:ATP-dependent 26S proteasome regulatory subunit
MARYLQPTMLVFEDIDLIAQERETNGLATVLGELMNQIDGCEPNDQVLFIMNTNSMERLEAAVRNRPGRVDQIIHIPLPDRDDRKRLINHFARSVRVAPTAVDALADATDRVTPAILKEVIKRAAVMAVERCATNGDGQGADGIELSKADLLLAVQQVLALRSDMHKLDPLAREPIRFGS